MADAEPVLGPRDDRLMSASPGRLPGDVGLWFFIVADISMFAIFFLVFAAGRASSPELFEQSRQQLSAGFGLANTLILLTSSLFMVKAVEAARAGAKDLVLRNLTLTLAIGACFAVFKGIEYTVKIRAGFTMLTNEFFTYYYIFTGVHFLHYLVGMGAILYCLFKARRETMSGPFIIWIEATGTYWHMVDFLWIMLFPMIYLLRLA